MSHHARVEEVSDSDPEDMDPSDFDPRNVISFAGGPSSSASHRFTPSAGPPPPAHPSSFAPPPTVRPSAQPPLSKAQASSAPPPGAPSIPKTWQCLYPVYFDNTRSRAQGRKVGSKLAVSNPLARDIVDAVQMLGLKLGFEGDKLHPKDWANPGRVRVNLRRDDGKLVNPEIKNKHHLYILVARYLQANPTTEESPLRLRVRGLPVPDKPLPAPVAPRGWKIGSILPIHSPAVSGGGVSENPFKDAMAEMQQFGMGGGGEAPGGSNGGGGGGGGEGKKKKDKKKGRA